MTDIPKTPEPFSEIHKAVQYIQSFAGKASDMRLPIADELIDPLGLNMALITDVVLGKGLYPNGFEQQIGFRVYLYQDME